MKKKYIVIIVIILLVIAGTAYYFVSKGKKQNKTDQTPTTISNNKPETGSTFDPVTTNDSSFTATITTTTADGKTTQSKMERDKSNGNVRFVSSSNGETVSMVYTKDAYYMCQNADDCIKYPLNGVGDNGFDQKTYEYTTDDIANLKNTSQYDGKKDCLSGICDVWKVKQNGYESAVYIDTKTKRIVQVDSKTDTGSTKILYEYKDVSITPPTNAQTLPTGAR